MKNNNKEIAMEYVDFYPKRFVEIPCQDNPAFNIEECFLLVKESSPVHSNKTLVLRIDPDDEHESVVHVAVFWDHGLAVEYCHMLCDRQKIC